MSIRTIAQIVPPQATMEGAGVKLTRTIASPEFDHHDPFLLLDHFASDNPADYLAGFPMHPHRGIETVTYLLAGQVVHRDSLGNSGTISPGDVQWMTSGSGIMHEEMPKPFNGKMAGFQLWVNIPARLKMSPPRYQEIPAATIPELTFPDGIQIKVIAGRFEETVGPVTEIAIQPLYLDVSIPAGSNFSTQLPQQHNAIAYLFEGACQIGGVDVLSSNLIVFTDGDQLTIQTRDQSARLLLVAGKPIGEPIARYGPFVMNTQAEIKQALSDLRNGTFVKG